MLNSARDSDKREQNKHNVAEGQDRGLHREIAGSGDPHSALAFCEQIRKDAEAEIEKILGKAQLSIGKRRDEAERQAESAVSEIKEAAQAQARTIEAKALSGVSLETKRTLLRVQGEIVEEVFAGLRARLRKLRETTKYRDFLKELTVQGIVAVDEEECVAAPGVEDRKLFTPQLVAEIEQIVESKSARKVSIAVSPDLAPEPYGVRVYSGARTALFDNTLDARMERLADELKAIVARQVFASDEAERSGQTRAAHVA